MRWYFLNRGIGHNYKNEFIMEKVKSRIWNLKRYTFQKIRDIYACVSLLWMWILYSDEDEFQSLKVVLNIVKNVTFLITNHIKKVRLITQEKFCTLYIFSPCPPPPQSGELKERNQLLWSLGLHTNSHLKSKDRKNPMAMSWIC